ncbi:MAG TPA: CehA/McbA family metallohydrolase [Vicinamibacterales bacterium]|nr:CehA/McbA family metallohydrolase [Vicinamibacterales bacterium]
MSRRSKIFAAAAAGVMLAVMALLPPGTRQTEPPPASTVRGAFHIHSTRSDGSGSVDDIAAAARRANLQFIILTDHGDGTRAPDPPAYRSEVLVLDGVELNTTAGHYAVIDLPAAPYPLAGTPQDVIEDVTRLGGFGFAAHPGSPRPSLSWQDWSAAIDGVEWINADSEWRDEGRLPIARALVTYLLRAPQSMATLLDRPAGVLERWDAAARSRQVVAIAAADAHARLGFRQTTDPDMEGVHVPLPGYESSFRTFSNHVVLDAPFSGDAAADARRLIGAIRAGHVYSTIDALATPGGLTFTAVSGAHSALVGDALPIEGDVRLRASVNAPPGTTLVLLKNGQRVHEVTDRVLETSGGNQPAVYRVEAYTAGAPGQPPVPWLVSNPIYAGLPSPISRAVAVQPVSRIPARTGEAAAEWGAKDTSTVRAGEPSDPRARTFAGDPAVDWTFALSPGIPVGQFAAVAVPVTGGLAAFDRVRFRVSASKPMRVWVQLRAPVGNTERWGATFYAGTEPELIDKAFEEFRAIGVTSSPRAPLDRVDTLLFVVDTLNTLPGTHGSMTIFDVGFVK